MTKPEVIRIIAQAMEDGAPEPINVSFYMRPTSLLVRDEAELGEWAEMFGLSVADRVYDNPRKTVRLGNDYIEIVHVLRAKS